jgi:nucleoside 2-deoxyribosyltransferase
MKPLRLSQIIEKNIYFFSTYYAEVAMKKTTIYQAGPLFTDSEKHWHKTARKEFEDEGFLVIWPGDLLTEDEISEAGDKGPQLIYETCKAALERSDIVVALLDGPQVDDGTAWEVGYACALGKPVFGIRTDTRMAGDTSFNNVNSMIECCLTGMKRTVRGLIYKIRQTLAEGN